MTNEPQTGAERLAQIREALLGSAEALALAAVTHGPTKIPSAVADSAVLVLDGCVLLTAEEAGYVKSFIPVHKGPPPLYLQQMYGRDPRDLLTPKEATDD